MTQTKRPPGKPGRFNAGSFSASVHGVIEKINIAAVTGILIAALAYLWANRLLPADLDDRAGWEVAIFFLVWLASVPYALSRPPRRAWIEQLGLAAALCLMLPILNGLTTDRHLLETIPRGDWQVAGVDLTLIGVGLALAWTARGISGRRAGEGTRRMAPPNRSRDGRVAE